MYVLHILYIQCIFQTASYSTAPSLTKTFPTRVFLNTTFPTNGMPGPAPTPPPRRRAWRPGDDLSIYLPTYLPIYT